MTGTRTSTTTRIRAKKKKTMMRRRGLGARVASGPVRPARVDDRFSVFGAVRSHRVKSGPRFHSVRHQWLGPQLEPKRARSARVVLVYICV